MPRFVPSADRLGHRRRTAAIDANPCRCNEPGLVRSKRRHCTGNATGAAHVPRRRRDVAHLQWSLWGLADGTRTRPGTIAPARGGPVRHGFPATGREKWIAPAFAVSWPTCDRPLGHRSVRLRRRRSPFPCPTMPAARTGRQERHFQVQVELPVPCPLGRGNRIAKRRTGSIADKVVDPLEAIKAGTTSCAAAATIAMTDGTGGTFGFDDRPGPRKRSIVDSVRSGLTRKRDRGTAAALPLPRTRPSPGSMEPPATTATFPTKLGALFYPVRRGGQFACRGQVRMPCPGRRRRRH